MYERPNLRILSRRGLQISPFRFFLGVLGLVVLAAGCAAVRVPEEPIRPTPMDPVWSEAELRDHLEFLNGEELMGRATGTQGYARAAAYVAARMREFRLQPAVGDDYRVVYGAAINYPTSSILRSVGQRDSTSYLPGVDYLPDARSDSGHVELSRFITASGRPDAEHVPATPFGVVVPQDQEADLDAWRRVGARLAVIVSELQPRFEARPTRGLIVMQVTPRAAALIFGVPEAELSGYFEAALNETITVPQSVTVAVQTDYQPQAGAINMLGYYSGKHPVRQRDAIILCADLDAVGHYAGVPAVDYRNFGVSTAALLEVARNLSLVTRRWSVPDRSVLVAVWSGSQTDHGGLRDFLRNPTWSLDRVQSVVYIGLSPEDEVEVRDILAAHDIPLEVVPPSAGPLFERDVVLMPSPAVLRLARSRDPSFVPLEIPDLSVVVDSAVVQARNLADKAYRRMMLRATEPSSFAPFVPDTLAVPSSMGTE